MRGTAIVWLLMFLCLNSAAQQSYCTVAPIIANKCVGCHNGIEEAPFDFSNYDSVKRNASLIKHVINTGYMPPWVADTTYRHFKNERVLTAGERKIITDWIVAGCKKCNPISDTDVKIIREKEVKPDTSFLIRNEVLLPDGDEKYVNYTFKLDNKKGKYIKRINFTTGANAQSIHHCNIVVSTDDNGKPGNPILGVGWTRGNSIPEFPKNTGLVVDSFVYLELEVHYVRVPVKTVINAAVEIYYSTEKPERKLEMVDCGGADKIGEETLLPADTIITYHIKHTLEKKISVFSVYPHMHIFGKKMLAYAITPGNDTMPLIKINKWVFDWQEQYVFNKPLILDKGTQIHLIYTYDNTLKNPANPNIPPKPIPFKGMKSYEEMLNFFLNYVDYNPADSLMQRWD